MPIFKVICVERLYFAQNSQGKYKDDDALNDVLTYCTRPGKAACVDGIGLYPPNAAYEMERLALAFGKDHGVRLRHWILSFSKAELKRTSRKALPDMLHRFGWYAASYYGHQYQILFAVHLDSEDPHIHFVMNTVNFQTGKKYLGNAADYYAYQRYLRDFFNSCGMELVTVADKQSQDTTRR